MRKSKKRARVHYRNQPIGKGVMKEDPEDKKVRDFVMTHVNPYVVSHV